MSKQFENKQQEIKQEQLEDVAGGRDGTRGLPFLDEHHVDSNQVSNNPPAPLSSR